MKSLTQAHTMKNNKMQLAPAAGSGIGKQLADELLNDPEFLPLMAKTARECLHALGQSRWDKRANDGTGGWVQDADMKTRAQMFFGLLAHMEGEPVKRIVHAHIGETQGDDGMLSALKDSPALRDAAQRMIDKANTGKRVRAAKAVQDVAEEAPVVPVA